MALSLGLAMAPELQAQTRQPAATKKKRAPARATAPAPVPQPPPPDFTAEREQVAAQIKLLSRFLYLYGRISVGLETADENLPQTRQNRANVVTNIGGIRAGLEKLGKDFQARPELQRQSVKLLEASEAAAAAERQAAANRFDEAGRTLVNVAERLAELQGLPLPR